MSETIIFMLTYNNEKTVEKSLDDLLSQTYKDYDLFIFDDHSTDSTYEICQRYSLHKNVHIQQNKENLGVLGNFERSMHFMNEKIKNSTFFMWACPDDEWKKTYLSSCIQILKENLMAVSCQSYVEVKSNCGKTSFIQKYNDIFAYNSFKIYMYIFQFLVSRRNRLFYNQCIHSVIRSEFVYKIFPLDRRMYTNLFLTELIIVGLMVAYGGLAICKESLTKKTLDNDPYDKFSPNEEFYILKNNNKQSKKVINSSRYVLTLFKDKYIKRKVSLLFISFGIFWFYFLRLFLVKYKNLIFKVGK